MEGLGGLGEGRGRRGVFVYLLIRCLLEACPADANKFRADWAGGRAWAMHGDGRMGGYGWMGGRGFVGRSIDGWIDRWVDRQIGRQTDTG